MPAPLFRRLLRAVKRLGETGLRTTYQTTFWMPRRTAPACVVEEAIAHVWPGGAGVEWWLSRMRTSNVQVDFHQDRDEKLALSGGPDVHPLRSSVLFLNRCRGGLLAVTSRPVEELQWDLVKPEPNRFVWFDGRLTHGVLDSHNELPGPRRPREKQLRLAVIANFWAKRPTGVPSFAESRDYRVLANAEPGMQGGRRRRTVYSLEPGSKFD